MDRPKVVEHISVSGARKVTGRCACLCGNSFFHRRSGICVVHDYCLWYIVSRAVAVLARTSSRGILMRSSNSIQPKCSLTALPIQPNQNSGGNGNRAGMLRIAVWAVTSTHETPQPVLPPYVRHHHYHRLSSAFAGGYHDRSVASIVRELSGDSLSRRRGGAAGALL